MKYVIILLSALAGTVSAESTLTTDIRISSAILGYDLQYRVYLPDGYDKHLDLPVLYVTDGPSYIKRGNVPRVLDKLIEDGRIEPVVAIFLDARDPDDADINRRNDEFFCSREYLNFFTDELIPSIERAYRVASAQEKRSILGVSFGGLNSACFGLYGYETFSGIGMHSPANHPVKELLPLYEQGPLLPLNIFLSTGNRNDNTEANRRFRAILENKGYPMEYVESRHGHNWNNWKPLIDDVLLYFYGSRIDKS